MAQTDKTKPDREYSDQVQFRVKPETRERFFKLCADRLISRNMAGDKALADLCDLMEKDTAWTH